MPSSILLTDSQRQKVDRYAVLDNERKRWSRQEREFYRLCKEIQSWFPDLGADETALAEGYKFEVEIGVKSKERDWISIAAVSEAVGGWKILKKICTVTFKAVAGVIGNAAAEALQSETQTGHRKLTPVAILGAKQTEPDSPEAA